VEKATIYAMGFNQKAGKREDDRISDKIRGFARRTVF